MNILVGHTNMDLDCMGSLVLARYLYPDYQPVRSRLIHPIAKNLYNMYQNHLDFIPSRELRGVHVTGMKIFDARSYHKVKEYFELMEGLPDHVEVYDHHNSDCCDIPRAQVKEAPYGANTTLVGQTLMEKDVSLKPEDATIALAGIFADTGNFSHGNVAALDFEVASYLMRQGADLGLVRHFIKTLKEEYQLTLFHSVLNRLNFKNIHGHGIMLCLMELEAQSNGLAAVVEKAFEVENPDALFVVFLMKKEKKTLIIGRSQKDEINLPELFSPWGGGGHPRAASALIKKSLDRGIYGTLIEELEARLAPAVSAADIMSHPVMCIGEDWSLLEASLFLERVQHTGAPVVKALAPEAVQEWGRAGAGQILSGFLTLRDISKGRRQGKMDHPVKAFMQQRVFSCAPEAGIRDLETLFFTNNIGHIPVVEENSRVAGIVTRSDYLNHLQQAKDELSERA